MNIIYNKIKELIPLRNALKIREDGCYLIVMPQNGNIQYLNEVAREFYLLIDGKKNIECIVKRMLEEYDVSYDELQIDILNLVRELQWSQLILLKEGGKVDEEKIC